MSNEFDGLVALVTGGASGIGAAIADPATERVALNARQPHSRLVEAAEVAGAVAYLASPLSGSTSGTSLAIDGRMQGLRLRPVG